MSNTTTPPANPHNLPPALARAQRPAVEPSLASLGIDAFEPAKPGEPGPRSLGPVGPKGIPGDIGSGIVQHSPAPAPNVPPAVPLPSGDPALFVYIATFAIKKGVAHSNVKIEVPCTGTPQGDKAAAWAEVRRQHPNAPKNGIVRTSEKIAPRAGTASQAIRLTDGMTIRQLFPDKTEFEATRLVGRISFESEPHDVILRHIRAKSVFSLTLKPLKGPATINFSEQVTTTRLAAELPAIINQLLGDSGKNLQLYFEK
jgi:hypothetical protein